MVKLREFKHQTEDKAIEKLPLPQKVFLPLMQHLGKPCVPRVLPGDGVSLGQKIASAEAHVFSPIHASVSGKVAAIQAWPHPVLGRCQAVVIETDGNDKSQVSAERSGASPKGTSQCGAKRSLPEGDKSQDWVDALTPEEIRKIVFEAGIVGMGGASFPTHIKLTPPKPIETLIVNGAECEPYLTSDYRLMVERCEEILKGIELIARCVGVKHVIIAIEDNKPEAVRLFKTEDRRQKSEVKVLNSAYPQGGEKQLIKNVLGKEVPSGKLPFDVGVLVQNVATCFAVYEAAYLGKPLYERVVTVAGSCVENPKNLLVRLGTPIKEVIASCGALKDEPAKVIVGGPMMGIAQGDLDAPVIKSTTGILLLNKEEALSPEEDFCIRCGACVRECPAGLMPTLINLASKKELWPKAKEYGAMDCIECGICAYICPSNIRLVHSIRRAKLETK